MTAPLFILLTDAEGFHDVAVNIHAIEVIEERQDGGTFVQTAQHAVVTDKPLAEVMQLLREVVEESEL